jgi:hypothetical protein
LAILLGAVVGCGDGRIPVPKVSPEAAARIALADYDTNGDGFIDATEAAKSPGLASALAHWSKTGKLSADEIIERFRRYGEGEAAIVGIRCRVLLNGTPLVGARVTFVPEKFMGPEVKPASGTSDEYGAVPLQIAGQEVEGVYRGVYRIEVSKKDAAGNELVPARYNAQTTLGEEVAEDPARYTRQSIVLRLTSE